jgi:hypothetical protein
VSNSSEMVMPAIGLDRIAPTEPAPRKSKAPSVWEQFGSIYTDPVPLFQRLAATPRWGHAFLLFVAFAGITMTCWALKVDVEALQRPVLENARLSASQIDQTIAISSRFILPMSLVSTLIRNLLGVLLVGLIFLIYAATTAQPGRGRSSFLHAVSAATVPGLVLVPYMLMISVVALLKPVGGQIPERLAPSGLAYYVRPHNAKLYGVLAQVDPFIVAYFAMIYLALRHTMAMKKNDASLCTLIAVLLTIGWKVYFWV